MNEDQLYEGRSSRLYTQLLQLRKGSLKKSRLKSKGVNCNKKILQNT